MVSMAIANRSPVVFISDTCRYGDHAQIRPYLLPVLHHNDHVLVTGCGNSNLSAGLRDDGYLVTSIDFSEVVIQEMRARHPDLTWELMDMTAMRFPDASFDAVVDKGSLDALMSEDNDLAASQAKTMFDEIIEC